MVTKTGSSYTTGTTNSAEIPTASPEFSTMVSPNKVSPSDCNNDRQPEMAMWSSKPEILISLALRQIGWQFQRQIWCFRPRPARRNWSRTTATTTDNQKWQYIRFARQSCNFWLSIVVAIIWLIFCQAGHHRKSGIWRWNFDAICHSSTDVIISGFGGHIDMSGCRSLLYTHLPKLFSTYTWSYTPDLSLEF